MVVVDSVATVVTFILILVTAVGVVDVVVEIGVADGANTLRHNNMDILAI